MKENTNINNHKNDRIKEQIQIIVATHKKYDMPNDPMYLPLHVGAEGKFDEAGNQLDLGYKKDNTGENISIKNPGFCELTGLYWAWKNLDSKFIGLVHYRRHFGHKKSESLDSNVMHYSEIASYLDKYIVLVPAKRRYYIETLYSHYGHTHYIDQLDETRKIIDEFYPDYINSFDRTIKRRWGYMFNMCIMRKDYFSSYCEWLFTILFELEKRIGSRKLSTFQSRFYGRISEIVFNVWLQKQLDDENLKKDEIKELPYFNVEGENWQKKGIAFLKAKFLHKRYEGSF